jgi:hypothetical protein
LAGWLSGRQRPVARRRAALNAFVNVAVLGLLGWLLVWFFVSDRFYVNHIMVTGNERLSADVIRQASGLQGYSSFWIHPQRIEAWIKESLPPIADVQVRYGLSNTVTLVVLEQYEQIMWQMSDGRYWVDEQGDLRPVQDNDSLLATDAPTADCTLLVKDIRSDSALSVETEALVTARQIVHLLPEVRVVEYSPEIGFRFLHPRGWMVYLGAGNELAYKVSILRAIEVQFAGQDTSQPTLLDLRYPNSPYYRLPGEQQSHGALSNSGGD